VELVNYIDNLLKIAEDHNLLREFRVNHCLPNSFDFGIRKPKFGKWKDIWINGKIILEKYRKVLLLKKPDIIFTHNVK